MNTAKTLKGIDEMFPEKNQVSGSLRRLYGLEELLEIPGVGQSQNQVVSIPLLCAFLFKRAVVGNYVLRGLFLQAC
jgi:hypothetical protein